MEFLAPLPSRALLRLDGGDVTHFLQNLVTCEVENLDDGDATFGALLTPQGKILFDFFLQRDGREFILDVAADQRDGLAKRLTFYKLRADVQIAMDDRPVHAAWGGGDDGGGGGGGEVGFIDPRLAELGQRIYGDIEAANKDEAAWQAHRIGLGMPQSGLDFEFGDAFPHEALMDQMESDNAGVDFSKGCYVGQEVVSRMQHRGTARNRFVIVSAEQPLAPSHTGQALTAAEKRVGTMGSTADNQGLALVRVDRVTTAISAGEAILLDGVELQVTRPAFAQYDWPQ